MSAQGKAIEFYFEFSSPYGYIAAQQVDQLGERVGRQVNWRPMLLGPVFKVTGQAPLVEVPMKGEYSKHDFARSARKLQQHRKRLGPHLQWTAACIAQLRTLDVERASVQ